MGMKKYPVHVMTIIILNGTKKNDQCICSLSLSPFELVHLKKIPLVSIREGQSFSFWSPSGHTFMSIYGGNGRFFCLAVPLHYKVFVFALFMKVQTEMIQNNAH